MRLAIFVCMVTLYAMITMWTEYNTPQVRVINIDCEKILDELEKCVECFERYEREQRNGLQYLP